MKSARLSESSQCMKSLPTSSNLASKLFRKNRAKMSSFSSLIASSSQHLSRSTRLRRSVTTKGVQNSDGSSGGGVGGTTTSTSKSSPPKNKRAKMQPPPLTPVQLMIRKLYEKINRAQKADQREGVKQIWQSNVDELNAVLHERNRIQTMKATTALSIGQAAVTADQIYESTLQVALEKLTTSDRIKVIVVPDTADDTRAVSVKNESQIVPVTTLSDVRQIPPVLDWTAIPHNLHEDDGKFLTNIPFLGDEFIDKDAKFIDEMVTLYEGKVHEAKDSSNFKKMNDEVLLTLVQALMRVEAEEGSSIFRLEGEEEGNILAGSSSSSNSEKNMTINVTSDVNTPVKNVEPVESNEDPLGKTTFSAVVAKLLFSDGKSSPPRVLSPIKTSTDEVMIVVKTEDEILPPPLIPEVEMPSSPVAPVEANEDPSPPLKSEEEIPPPPLKAEDLSPPLKLEDEIPPPLKVESMEIDSEITETQPVNLPPSLPKPSKPSEAVFSILASTFSGLGTEREIRERYENAEKATNTPVLPILPNGMELQSSQSYSIPNVEGPFAKYLPKEATMHAYQILFCRRCFTYDCKRHNGDDQVDVKYYKNRQNPVSSSLSTSSAITSFNFLCKNPDCWQMNDTEERNSEQILAEWSPGDRSLFLCFIDSFPSNYCFIAYLMRNKTCLQVKEYATLENVPKVESCPRVSSRKPRHRKQRLGLNKKLCGSNNKQSVTRRWINNVKKTEKSKEEGGIKSAGGKLPPRYIPCLHEKGGECDATCSCRINKTSCEKFCTCSLNCPYRFPGCRCSGRCSSKRCICFAGARECDPDLCGCGAHEEEVNKISCHNVNIQRKLHKHLLMGASDISGWGIYIKNDAQKGEFIAEYRGELISHDESERRGHVYDKIQHTYLFELNDHFVVDATRKGNKSRFVNSSKNPNCEVKRMLVNGDHRIGIYAKRYIEAGEELFYDYEDVLEKQQKAAKGAVRKSARE